MTQCSKLSMSVNIRLCGGIPRADMLTKQGAPCGLSARLSTPCLAESDRYGSKSSTLTTTTKAAGSQNMEDNINSLKDMFATNTEESQQQSQMMQQSSSMCPVLEPPTWAVPARGETRLEPVCDTYGRHASIDLTTQSCFRVGRSLNSDIQLLHGTTSRRHAMVFHHRNGSCYLVDCGSAHGTYVNGRRISSPMSSGLIIPHKVRRGALVRFGGPGAPCFVLKSFSFQLNDIKTNAETEASDLVRRNTRINALGKSAVSSISEKIPSLAIRKRYLEAIQNAPTMDFDECEPCAKRMRCSSPPPSPEEPLRLVSPDLSVMSVQKRRVHFSLEPPQSFFPTPITPDVLSSDEEEGA